MDDSIGGRIFVNYLASVANSKRLWARGELWGEEGLIA